MKFYHQRWVAVCLALLAFKTCAAVLYVDSNSSNPESPYAGWSTAASSIQDAIDAASDGDQVLVTNGVYQTGGEVVYGALTNRVAVNKAVTVRSVNGPATTVIRGYQDTNTITGDDAVRCVYMTNGAILSGFTLTNGATLYDQFESLDDHLYSGGGVYCESLAAVVSNCIITSCSASDTGGGATGGTLNNCILTNSSSFLGGGAGDNTLNHCVLAGNSAFYGGGIYNSLADTCRFAGNSGNTGGGAYYCTLTNCSLTANSAPYSGGADTCTLNSCTLTGNSASYAGAVGSSTVNNCALAANTALLNGGGADNCTLSNCTLTGNSALNGGGAESSDLIQCSLIANTATNNGGGADGGQLNNCTLTGNSAVNAGGGANAGALNNCALTGNDAGYGGGAEGSTLNNCTLTGNSAVTGGGADSSTLNNCIAFYNAAPGGDNYSSSTLNFSCTTPAPGSGVSNIIAEPELTDAAHIGSGSPCIGAGSTNYSTGVDIDGDPWLNPPSIGCDEYVAGSPTGALSVAIQAGFTNVAAGFAVNFTGLIVGHAGADSWAFGDGTVVSNQLSASHSWSSAGTYPVVLTVDNTSNPAGVSATVFIHVLKQPVAYVSVSNLNPVPPYLTWNTAATNLQDAVDAVYAGGTVWVTNGVYQTGGRAFYGQETNRVMVANPLTVQSVNGPAVTLIDGGGVMRCMYLIGGTALSGFTLTNGVVSGDGGGGWCQSSGVLVSNCVLSGNSAGGSGGGIFSGILANCTLTNNYGYSGGAACFSSLKHCTLINNQSYYGGGASASSLLDCTLTGNFTYIDSDYTANGGGASGCNLTNCLLRGNSSISGGGACGSTLVNCTLAGNSSGGGGGVVSGGGGGGACGSTLINCTLTGNVAGGGGGVSSSVLTNCIVYFNTAPSDTNYSPDCTLLDCDTTPLPGLGANNITSDPQLADLEHISSVSPCRGAGSAAATSGVDIDGDTWLNPPSIGCDEFYSSSATGALAVAISETFTNVTTGFTVDFAAQISGHATGNRWNFGDGTMVSNELFTSHSWAAAGTYPLNFTAFNSDHPAGVSTSVTIYVLQNPVHYVALNNATPVPPYLSWATAATNIQDAVDAAFAGGTIVVSNGIYQTGLRVLYGTMSNRVAVTKPLTLQSVSGAAATVLDGGLAVRCLYLTNHVSVTGFTLRNGVEINGAGVFCQSADDVLSNCLLTGNSSPADWSSGGGAYGGTLNHCTFTNNSASYLGGGAYGCILDFCSLVNNGRPAYGGGAGWCTLNNCLVISNTAAWGGGVLGGVANNCAILGNLASYGGGGEYYGALNNCTLVSNTVPSDPGTYGGAGAYDGTLNNCIVYYNNGDNYDSDFYGIGLNYCCTTPDPGSTGNISNAPLLVDLASGDFHLQTNSPCINSGYNSFVTTTNDLDGKPRIQGGTVDIGAYEFQTPTSVISYAWLQHYGLPTDGSADFIDSDGDGMNNWQEWRTGTVPTDPLSGLKMTMVTNDVSGLTVTWQSVSGITYLLQRSTNLAAQPAFFTIQTNIAGQAGTTSYTDPDATNSGPYFYRVGVP
ncbi:MAG: PKD domain-containing protein [Verrucomicrobiia bacterium]